MERFTVGLDATKLERMLSLLHPQVQVRAEELSREFAGGQPFRHVVIDPFLDPAFCNRLIAEFPAFDAERARNEMGGVGRKAVFPDLARLGPAYAQFDRLMSDRAFLKLAGRITGMPGLIYDPEYIGGGTHENLEGQELDTHVDFNYHPKTHTHRRLNLIVFLNPEWEERWGGRLELLRDPWASGDAVKMVTPLANRCVIFETTEASWHGFRRIQLPAGKNVSRRSIAVYFYTREAPPRGAAPPHATFYFQRPLPEHIRAGYTLREEDLAEIQTLLARRDQNTQFLYEREMEFSRTISNITLSRTFRWGRRLAAPVEMLRRIFRG
jgi:2-oxoglutarate-Fe(II)-dependent oxygenase superfamily protein